MSPPALSATVLALLLPVLASAGPAHDPVEAKIASGLRPLLSDPVCVDPSGPEDRIKLVLQLAPQADLASVRAAAEQLPGTEVQVASRGIVQLWGPAWILRDLASIPGVARVREPRRARPKTVSEGVDVVLDPSWRERGLTGAGQRVAILDVEFAGYRSLLGTELPDQVETYFLSGEGDGGHGTAVAEIVHDLAPDAELAFYQFSDEGEFLLSIDRMIQNGETIVNASIGFDNIWHADGTSSFSRAVDDLVATGAVYVAAAGNEADCYWVGTLRDDNGDGWLEFDGVDEVEVWGWPGLDVVLRWDEPFGDAAIDIDLYLYDESGVECDRGEDTQDGRGDPIEEGWCRRPSWGSVSAYDYSGGAAVGRKAWLYAAPGIDDAHMTLTESLTLPADSERAITVGAVEWDTLALASYSSHGPTNDGRLKPDLVAPAEVSTVAYGFQDFPGTSAAAPHVAGLVALLRQHDPDATPAQVKSFLIERAETMGDGPNNATGHGLAHSGVAPDPGDPLPEDPVVEDEEEERRACGCAHGSTGAGAWLVLVALIGVRRRRAALGGGGDPTGGAPLRA